MKALLNWRKARRRILTTPLPSQYRDGTTGLNQNLADKVKLATNFKGRVFLCNDKDIIPSLDVRVERKGENFHLHIPNLDDKDDRLRLIIERAPTVIGWMYCAGSDVTEVKFHLSDGQLPSLAQCSFSSYDPTKLLVPDFYFFRDHGYQGLRDWVAKNDVPWSERNNEMVWRGRLTGAGLFSIDPAQRDNPLIRQRLRLAMHAKDTPLDFRFVSAVTPLETRLISNAGLMADRIDSRTWGGRKFAVDIDGFSTTWDNLFHRLLMGNCVLKVDSQIGFSQWYYHRLRPYENYVPIKKDLSNLREQIDWVLHHDDEAREIARAGQKLAENLTWEAVVGETRHSLRSLVGLSA